MTHLRRRSWALRGLLAVSGLAVVLGCSSEKEPSERVGKTSQALSTGLVISQVYGSGGNGSAVYDHDFVELFNRGDTPVVIAASSMSVQYASSGGQFTTANTVVLPAVTIPSGGYFLIELHSGGSVGAALPAPDLTATGIDMSGTNGKVALVNGITALTCDTDGGTTLCSTAASVVDFLGYGTANDSETAPALATAATKAAVRKTNGCTETDNNLLDFDIITTSFTPRNSGSPTFSCSASDAGTDAGDTGDAGVPDTGTPDTGTPDTGLIDTGLIDTGPDDTGTPDTGTPDTGVIDTGVIDTGVIDTGPDDTGLVDTGVLDTGLIDTGVLDTGLVDTGVDTGAADVGGTDTATADTGGADVGPADTALDDTAAVDSAILDALDGGTDSADGGADVAADTGSDGTASDTATGGDTTASGDTAPVTDSSTSDALADTSSTADSSPTTDSGGSDAGVDDSGFDVEGSGCKCEMPGNQPRREVDVLALGAGLAGLLLMRRRRR